MLCGCFSPARTKILIGFERNGAKQKTVLEENLLALNIYLIFICKKNINHCPFRQYILYFMLAYYIKSQCNTKRFVVVIREMRCCMGMNTFGGTTLSSTFPLPRRSLVVSGSICITTELVFSAPHLLSACWLLASFSAKWAANSGEITPPFFASCPLLIVSLFLAHFNLTLTLSESSERKQLNAAVIASKAPLLCLFNPKVPVGAVLCGWAFGHRPGHLPCGETSFISKLQFVIYRGCV